MKEMKTLTLNGKTYDSFPDQEARAAIEELKQNGLVPDSGQNPTGGLSATAANLLIYILRSGVYEENVSNHISALAEELAKNSDNSGDSGDSGGSGGSGTEDDTPVVSNYYTVSYNLDNVESNNNVDSIKEGSQFVAVLTANTGFKIDSVVVTMGGTDITDSAYSDGTITIENVTGDIVISATTVAASAYAFENGIYTESSWYSIEVSNGNHVKYTTGNHRTVNFSHVLTGHNSVKMENEMFSIPAGATVSVTISNFTTTGAAPYICGRLYETGTGTVLFNLPNNKKLQNGAWTATAENDCSVGCVGWFNAELAAGQTLEFDIEIKVNDALYIG